MKTLTVLCIFCMIVSLGVAGVGACEPLLVHDESGCPPGVICRYVETDWGSYQIDDSGSDAALTITGADSDGVIYPSGFVLSGLDLPIAIDGNTETFTLRELRALLERCREFVRDNSSRDVFGPITTTTDYIPSRDNPNRLDLAREEAEAAKARVDRLERETQLRRDIEAAIERLAPEAQEGE